MYDKLLKNSKRIMENFQVGLLDKLLSEALV